MLMSEKSNNKKDNVANKSFIGKVGETNLPIKQASTGSRTQKAIASALKGVVDFVRDNTLRAEGGGTITNATNSGKGSKTKQKTVRHTSNFDSIEEAKEFAKEHNLDPDDIVTTVNSKGQPTGKYSIK